MANETEKQASDTNSRAPLWTGLSLAILAGVMAWVFFGDDCIQRAQFSLLKLETEIRFCTVEERAALRLFEEAEKTFESSIADASPEERERLLAEFRKHVEEALRMVRGEVATMGPLEDGVREALEPYLP